VVELDPEIRSYYERGEEQERLSGGSPTGALERERTRELLQRFLPPPPARVLDVGGGPGPYATWLLDLGYDVRLVDPVPLHVEQAAAAGVPAELGDARDLQHDDGAFDVVLLLGPLYHLLDRAERIRALREANRVVRPGGVVAAAAIARFAALLDLLVRHDRLHEPEVAAIVWESVATGVFRGTLPGLFTNAYVHRPDELLAEVADAGLVEGQVFDIEGPGSLVRDVAERWEDPARRGIVLEVARLLEAEPATRGAWGHLLAVARRPEQVTSDGRPLLDRRTYLEGLPRKRVGVGIVCTDRQGRVLLVHPTYRPEWLVPGGVVEADESPRRACEREVAEELGVTIDVGDVLCVEYRAAEPERSDESLQMLFDGGTVDGDVARFSCADGEIDGYAFVDPADLEGRVTPHLARRIRRALAARAGEGDVYLE
jgi:SAM-dependent methyltransferase/ADP-ribose pyrophosphatase YjhB (NUDIX family)